MQRLDEQMLHCTQRAYMAHALIHRAPSGKTRPHEPSAGVLAAWTGPVGMSGNALGACSSVNICAGRMTLQCWEHPAVASELSVRAYGALGRHTTLSCMLRYERLSSSQLSAGPPATPRHEPAAAHPAQARVVRVLAHYPASGKTHTHMAFAAPLGARTYAVEMSPAALGACSCIISAGSR